MNCSFPFLDPGLPLKERIRDLVSRLTVEEKAGFIPTRNAAVERLGIPAYSIGAEGAHGFVDRAGRNTTFPQTIGLASSWDRELVRKVGEVSALEARAYYKAHNREGGLALWSPTIDMERDPRWGRTEEGYGEDPCLTAELSSAYIQGAQGDDPFYLRVSCGPKHFLANNNERDRGVCSCSIPARCLHEYYLAPFRTAVTRAKAASLMTSYNEVNGIPMMLHPILRDVVKKEWGFEGHVVTDGGDFLMTVNLHHYFESHAETLAAGLSNGADCMTDEPREVVPAVLEALKRNLITEADLDEHLARILAIRFRLGQFDPEGRCPYDAIGGHDLMRDEYRLLAREAVRKSVVLLKNEGAILPLRPDKVEGLIAVMGPLAAELYLDWYAGHPPYACTPLDGLRELYGPGRIRYIDCRDIVSFTAQDGRPLVLIDPPESGGRVMPGGAGTAGRVLAVGGAGERPACFYVEDWGWGALTLADTESGLLLEAPFLRQEQGASAEYAQNQVSATAKSSLNWFVTTLFNLIPQEDGFVLLRTWDNRRLSAPGMAGPVQVWDEPIPRREDLFRVKIERDGLSAAGEAAANAGQVIFLGGNNPMINGREEVDRPSLDLPPRQEELIRRVSAVNPKTILALISGYPYTCGPAAERVPAVLWMAHGLQETGHGLADVLGGNYAPAGRLSLTWYEDAGQLPPMMEYDIISAGSTYQYFSGKVLWPFGHGLSYSEFSYSDLKLDKTAAGEDETLTVSCTLENIGGVEAEEVPQLYVTVTGSSFRRPLKSLKGFTRLSLRPGEKRLVRFTLPVRELAVWESRRGGFSVEQSYCVVSVGASSSDIRLSGGFEVRGKTPVPLKLPGGIYAEGFDDYSGCFLHEKRGSGIPGVFNRRDGAWLRYRCLDFADGASLFSAIARGEPGSRIEIRLDAPEGRLAGTVMVANTGDICSYPLPGDSPRRRPLWASVEGKTEKIRGVHDLYLVFYGKTGLWRFHFFKERKDRAVQDDAQPHGGEHEIY